MDLLFLLYDAYRALVAGRRTRSDLRYWALAQGYELVSLRRERSPQRIVDGQFTDVLSRVSPWLFYEIETIDPDGVLRTGLARVYDGIGGAAGGHELVEVMWLSGRQGNWFEHPALPTPVTAGGPTAQGWCADPTGRHAERWFSLGLPTSLVRDGRVEDQDQFG